MSGNLITTGNSKFANSTTSYGNGAGLISFIANGGILDFYISNVSTGENTNVAWGIPKLRIMRTGNVGIGVTNPTEKLVVDGTILAEEVKVQNVPSSDYVFEPDYPLLSLSEVETHIKERKHLPGIPSAEEFKQNGVGLGEMDDMLLRKVEELTLYVLQQQKEIQELKSENEKLTDSKGEQVDELLRRIEKLEKGRL